MTLAPTTTVDRVAEIAAIFEDIERRRLQAIYDQDEEAFLAVFANEEYAKRSLVAFHTVEVVNPNEARLTILNVFHQSADCIAIEAQWDKSKAIVGGATGLNEHVVEMGNNGWGLSWVGKGWRCDGPHPFSG